MLRFKLDDLVKWKDSKRRKPLVIWGARQVGKTYLAEELFAKQYFPDNYLLIDFKKEDEIREFCFGTADAKKIISYIELAKGKKISEHTLLIFDEVQECPNIVSALKYFCQDFPQIPVIVTGSMVRIKLVRQANRNGKKEKFLFPVGKINQITLYPLNFGEFLINRNSLLYDKVRDAYEAKVPLPTEIHKMALNYVYEYLLIGGMPEAVDAYIQSDESLLESRSVLKDLYDNYLADMELYQASHESVLKSRAVFMNIYKELNRENKNFSPGLIEKNTKTRDFTSALQWLNLANVINSSYLLNGHITTPLTQDNSSLFRIFLGDIGMFTYQSGTDASAFISSDKRSTLSGIFFENYMACELVSAGVPLFYWKGKSSAEFEFVVYSGEDLFPIDVKKGRGVLNSLEKFSQHNAYKYAVKVSSNNFGFSAENKILTVPFYFSSFLAEDLANGTMPDF